MKEGLSLALWDSTLSSLLPVVVVVDVVDDCCEERALEDARPEQEAALNELLPGDVSLVIALVAVTITSVSNS